MQMDASGDRDLPCIAIGKVSIDIGVAIAQPRSFCACGAVSGD
jgi:hypothetical protein